MMGRKNAMRRTIARMASMVLFMGVLYPVRVSVWEIIPERLVVVLHTLRIDAADFHLRHAEGTESAGHVVEVDDVVLRKVCGLRFADRTDIIAVTVGANDGGVAGADAADAGAIVLTVLDAHPPGIKHGVEERGALPHGEGTRGEREVDGVTGGGAHVSIVPHDGECV